MLLQAGGVVVSSQQTNMLGHVSLGVRDIERSRRFYDETLGALGFLCTFRGDRVLGYGPPGEERLNLFLVPSDDVGLGAGFHLAFDAPDRDAVRRFHAAALANGGRCNGPPGLRERYSPTYFAAFVIDPDGHRLEAVHQ